MSQQSSSCLLEDWIPKLIPKWDHLIPVTASLSSFDMMMLLLWLNLYRIQVFHQDQFLLLLNVIMLYFCSYFCNVLLCDIPDAVRKTEVLELLILDVPQLEAV